MTTEQFQSLLRAIQSNSSSGGGAGAATADNQITGNNSLASIDSKTPTLGQKTMANSIPVVIASDQNNLSAPTTGTITTNASTVTVTNLNDTGAVTVAVYGTYAGVNFTFEAYDSVNWHNIGAQRVDTGAIELTTGVIGSVTRAWNVTPLLGFSQFRVRATAYTSGTANIIIAPSSQFVASQISIANTVATTLTSTTLTSVTPGTGAANLGKAEDATHTTGDTLVGIAGVRQDALLTNTSGTNDYGYVALNRFGALLTAGFRTTGRTISASAQISPVATATDIMGLFGNGTTTLQVTKIRVTCVQTTAGIVEFFLIKRSTANTGSTPVNFSLAAHEAGDTNSSTPVAYTATNPTTGTPVGTIRRWHQVAGTASTGTSLSEYTLEFGENGKPIILSGTAQGLCLNFNGATVPAGLLVDVSIEYIEF